MDQPKLERLLRLMKLLTANTTYNVDQLAERLQMSRRTVYRYIDTFRDAGFVIKKSGDCIRLDKESPHFKDISQLIHFTEEEAVILKSAIENIDDDNLLKQNLKRKLYSVYDNKTLADTVVRGKNAPNIRRLIEAIEQELAQGEEIYRYPPITLLEENHTDNCTEVGAELRNNSRRLADALRSFGVDATAGDVVHGPSVTRYEFTLEQGVKLSKITNLSDDIALALGASGVRVAPVPNKISVVGIEVPNRTVTAVRIRDVIESREFTRHPSPVAFAVGKDIGGNNIVGNIARLPHVLIAGTTGSGKSVCTNSLIVSLLYKSTPDEVRFIMVDPKMVELAPYNGIPHLLIPVVTDPKKAAGALQWAVFEMMKRYKTFSEHGVKKLEEFNRLARASEDLETLPSVVVVIDELADLMLVAGLRHSEIGFQEGAAAAGFRRGIGEHPLESFAGLFPALLVRFGGDVEIGGGEPFFVHVEERRAVRGDVADHAQLPEPFQQVVHLFGRIAAPGRYFRFVDGAEVGENPFVQTQQNTDDVVQIVADHPQAVEIVAADAEEDARGVGRFVQEGHVAVLTQDLQGVLYQTRIEVLPGAEIAQVE